MLQMSQQLRQMGLAPPGMGSPLGGGAGAGAFGNPFGAGGAGGAGGFPAPGQPSYAQQQQQTATPAQGQGVDSAVPNTGGSPQQPNPFAALASLMGGMPPQGQAPGGAAGAFDPAMMSGLLGFGAGGA